LQKLQEAFDFISDETTTGQVHSFQMTNAPIDAANKYGLNFIIGEASGIRKIARHKASLSSDGKRNVIDVVFAAGPWTGLLPKIFQVNEPDVPPTLSPGKFLIHFGAANG